jgi:hypothetical protein
MQEFDQTEYEEGRPPKGNFKKGRKKTGGRQKGTPNKVTKALKAQLTGFVTDNFEAFIEDLNNMYPDQRAKLYVKIFEYVLPKQKQIDLDGEVKINALKVEFKSTNRAPRHNESDFIDD